MIVICTHQSPDILQNFLNSIKENQTEDHKILVVETSSSEISKNIAQEYNCIFTNSELKYEIGAYNHALSLYPDEDEYFMFQDSFEIVQSGWEDLFRQLSQGKKLVSICNYHLMNDPCPGCGKIEFESLFNKPFPTEHAYGVLANSFYVPALGAKLMLEFGLNKVKADNKVDTYAIERMIGAIAYYACGYDDLSSALGDYNWVVDHFVPNTGFTIFIQKIIHKRQ